MNESRFAIRTIRRGRVKVGQMMFAPSEQWKKYDGRLDGLKYAFGRYRNADRSYKPLLCLLGPAAAFHSQTDFLGSDGQVVNGYLPWYWWKPIMKA